MRLNNAGTAPKTSGYQEQLECQLRAAELTVLVSVAYQRRSDPATRSFRLPHIMRGLMTTAGRRYSTRRAGSFIQLRTGGQTVSASVSSVRPIVDKSPLNDTEQTIAGSHSNDGITVTQIANYASTTNEYIRSDVTGSR